MTIANNVVEFRTTRSQLISRNRKEALPALFSVVLVHLQAYGVPDRRLSGFVEVEAGPFMLLTGLNGHGHYVRVDRSTSRLFTGYWHPARGYHVMTWRRHPSWESALYDEISSAVH